MSFEELLSLRLRDQFTLVLGCINNNLNLWKKDACKVFTGIWPPLCFWVPWAISCLIFTVRTIFYPDDCVTRASDQPQHKCQREKCHTSPRYRFVSWKFLFLPVGFQQLWCRTQRRVTRRRWPSNPLDTSWRFPCSQRPDEVVNVFGFVTHSTWFQPSLALSLRSESSSIVRKHWTSFLRFSRTEGCCVLSSLRAKCSDFMDAQSSRPETSMQLSTGTILFTARRAGVLYTARKHGVHVHVQSEKFQDLGTRTWRGADLWV